MKAGARPAAQPAIAVKDLSVVRGGRPVLRRLSLAVRAGVVTGLLGPSGSGKTTLMRAIVGVQRTSDGTVEVLGLPAGASAVRARIGYMTQAPSVYADLTVRENLRYFARILGVTAGRVAEVIALVRLEEHADRIVNRLSGGERARASLATALLGAPPVLVLDEPTVGLDPVLRRDLWNSFHELAAAGTAVLVSSHVMDEAERCDELILLREGTVVASASPAELQRRTGTTNLDAAFLRLIEREEPA